MSRFDDYQIQTKEEQESLHVHLGSVFSPRSPISNRAWFAGRWDQITTIADSILQVGLHVVIFGERGVGKTSLSNVIKPIIDVFHDKKMEGNPERLVIKVNSNKSDTFTSMWKKVFDEVVFKVERNEIGFLQASRDEFQSLGEQYFHEASISVDQVRRILSSFKGGVFVIDEFDRVAAEEVHQFTDLIKGLSDYTVDSTIILVGVSKTIDSLIQDHNSITRALVQIHLPRMSKNELLEIIKNAEKESPIIFEGDAKDLITHLSQGLPHYTHLIGQLASRHAVKNMRKNVSKIDVQAACDQAVRVTEQSISRKYETAVSSAHQDALYQPILLACAMAAANRTDDEGYFQAISVVGPLSRILKKTVTVSTFHKHLVEWTEVKRGAILDRVGKERAYKYKFNDPLLVPYILMLAYSREVLAPDDLEA